MKLLLIAILSGLFATASLRAEDRLEAPVPVRTVLPKYPDELRREGIVGVVTISCVIDELGNVTDALVEKTTNEGFNAAALEALKKWKFKPAKLDGNPVAKKIVIPLRFNISEA